MSLIWFTDVKNENKVAVNPEQVTVVFTADEEGEFLGKTVIGLINGSVVVAEDILEVVTALG